MQAAVAHGVGLVIGFGRHADARARLMQCTLSASASQIEAEILGEAVSYRLQMPGLHWALNSLAVLAAAKSAGVDLAAGRRGAGAAPAAQGSRPAREDRGGGGGTFELIDESYNASPAAMRAAFQVLAQAQAEVPAAAASPCSATCASSARPRALLHADLAPDLKSARVDLVFTAGPLMEWLHASLPETVRGVHAADSQALIPAVVEAVRAGDVVLVKGSLGSRMAPIVEALRALEGQALPRAANGN